MRAFAAIRRSLCAIADILLSAFPARPQTWYFNGNDMLTNDRDFNRAYHWSSAQNRVGAHPVSDRDDDFTSNTLGSKWLTHDADNDGSTGAYDLTTNADQLTITIGDWKRLPGSISTASRPDATSRPGK